MTARQRERSWRETRPSLAKHTWHALTMCAPANAKPARSPGAHGGDGRAAVGAVTSSRQRPLAQLVRYEPSSVSPMEYCVPLSQLVAQAHQSAAPSATQARPTFIARVGYRRPCAATTLAVIEPLPSQDELAQCLATLEALHRIETSKLASIPTVGTILSAGYALARRAGSALRDRDWKRPRRADEPPLDDAPRDETEPETTKKRRPFSDPDAARAMTSDELRMSERARPADRTLRCYLCDEEYRGDPSDSSRQCASCAALSASKRARATDLRGRVALVTGARIRIGYAVSLSLLRAGAHVHGTTRFTAAAIERFAREPDYHQWSERLELHALDLCDLPSTERFAERMARTLPALDILVNNAARTIDHPPSWLDAMRALDAGAKARLPASLAAATPSLDDRAAATTAPAMVDEEGQPLDERARNAWRARIGEVSLRELLAVHAVNALAPFVLIDRLRALMTPGDARPRFVVNVTSPEGRFYRRYKGPWHPHTNMAKAALDMLTRTCGEELAQAGLYVTSVDPGWVSDLHTHASRAAIVDREDWAPPVSLTDAAARVLDPVYSALDGEAPLWGVALRNFSPCPW